MKSQRKNYSKKNKKTKKNGKKNNKRNFKSSKMRGGSKIPLHEREQYDIDEQIVMSLIDSLNIDWFSTTIDLKSKLITLNTDSLLGIFAYEFIKNLSNVENIDISYNNLNADIVNILDTIPTTNTKLKTLNVSNNNLGVKDSTSGFYGYHQVFNLLYRTKNKIEILDISNNNIGDNGAQNICLILNHTDYMNNNKTLTELNISNNNIGQNGAKEIGNKLNDNKILKKLNISNNNCGDVGIHPIIVSINKGLPLTTLDISNNNITDKKVGDIIRMLNTNKTLTTLNISGNKISDINMGKINDIMKSRIHAQESILQKSPGPGVPNIPNIPNRPYKSYKSYSPYSPYSPYSAYRPASASVSEPMPT